MAWYPTCSRRSFQLQQRQGQAGAGQRPTLDPGLASARRSTIVALFVAAVMIGAALITPRCNSDSGSSSSYSEQRPHPGADADERRKKWGNVDYGD